MAVNVRRSPELGPPGGIDCNDSIGHGAALLAVRVVLMTAAVAASVAAASVHGRRTGRACQVGGAVDYLPRNKVG